MLSITITEPMTAARNKRKNDDNTEASPLTHFAAPPFGSGGEAGIRTLGGHKPSLVFETSPFDRSGTSPFGKYEALPA